MVYVPAFRFYFFKINFLSKNQYSSCPVNLLNFILTKQSRVLLSHPAHLAALRGRCCCLQWTHCWGLDGPQGCLAPSSGWTGTWTQVQVGWSGIQSPFYCATGSSWVLFSLAFLLKRNPSPGLQAWLPPTSLCCLPCSLTCLVQHRLLGTLAPGPHLLSPGTFA